MTKYREPEIIVPELEKLVGTARSRYWSAKDEATLRRYYNKVPLAALAKVVGHGTHACQKKAHVMGISRHRVARP